MGREYTIREDMPTITKRILQQLNEQGHTAQWLQQQTGLSQGAISKIVNGESSNIASLSLCKIADAFGVTTDYLLGRTAAATVKNLDTRAICDKTGLNEKSVAWLIDMQSTIQFCDRTISGDSIGDSTADLAKIRAGNMNQLKTINLLLAGTPDENSLTRNGQGDLALICEISEYINRVPHTAKKDAISTEKTIQRIESAYPNFFAGDETKEETLDKFADARSLSNIQKELEHARRTILALEGYTHA